MAVQEIEKELEQEYKRFIEFGNLLDRRRRTYIIQYLQNKFDPQKHIIPSLKEQYYEYFQRALPNCFFSLIQSFAQLFEQLLYFLVYAYGFFQSLFHINKKAILLKYV
ncbi:hypothetical protein [Okeania hirsuta]|uniref:hypothetical protein n=1 Tax=Okeania hirsuta TaxID=1458930 RepID=UPI000F530BEE|nr:hypothetical protein [Okeania hirsuta]